MAIAAAEKLLNSDEISQVLILCPASLKYQWADKIKEFTDSSVMVIDGPKHIRTEQYKCQRGDVPACEYLIGSYDGVVYDYEDVSKIKPDVVICDEVSAIKSFKAIRSKRVKKLFGKVSYRLGLTATPIENRPEELYSIMQFIDGTVLGRYDLFEKAYIERNKYGWVKSYKNLDILRARMGDALARKTRHDPEVRAYLPDVDEDNWTVPMTKDIFSVYQIIAGDMLKHLNENSDLYVYYPKLSDFNVIGSFDQSTPDGKLMAMHMCIEMLLDHPELLRWSAKEYEKGGIEGSEYAHDLVSSGILNTGLVPAKMNLLLQELDKLLADPDSKIIIVSRYKYMLQLLSYAIPYPTITFTGDMSAKEKAIAIDLFSYIPENRILLTSHAGGYGLDLYMADYLINYDLPWSAGTRDQISSRHIRASSSFDKVYIRNLVTENSIEERKQRMLDRKAKIIDAAIDGGPEATVSVSDDLLRDHLEKIVGKGLTRKKYV